MFEANHCSFCGKHRTEVAKLVSGPKVVAVCNNCYETMRTLMPEPVAMPPEGSAKPIPVHEARAIAARYTYDQVIIFARKVGDEGMEHLTTYGRDKEHCDVAARVGDFLKHKIMGWVRENVIAHEDHRKERSQTHG